MILVQRPERFTGLQKQKTCNDFTFFARHFLQRFPNPTATVDRLVSPAATATRAGPTAGLALNLDEEGTNFSCFGLNVGFLLSPHISSVPISETAVNRKQFLQNVKGISAATNQIEFKFCILRFIKTH